MKEYHADIARLVLTCVFIAAALVVTSVFVKQASGEERPTVNISPGNRQSNWNVSGRGSCVHATFVSLLRWQGQHKAADRWRKIHGGGEKPESFASDLRKSGIRYAYSTKGDVAFLEWACRTRRGCGIDVNGGKHMVALVHLDQAWAAILDPNDVSKFIWIPREKLIRAWKASRGWAVTPAYSPAAPLPSLEFR